MISMETAHSPSIIKFFHFLVYIKKPQKEDKSGLQLDEDRCIDAWCSQSKLMDSVYYHCHLVAAVYISHDAHSKDVHVYL